MSDQSFIAQRVSSAIQNAIWPEIMLIAGNHIQRDGGGKMRFLPGKNKLTFMTDVEKFVVTVQQACRGITFNLRVTDTDAAGVDIALTTFSNVELGASMRIPGQ